MRIRVSYQRAGCKSAGWNDRILGGVTEKLPVGYRPIALKLIAYNETIRVPTFNNYAISGCRLSVE